MKGSIRIRLARFGRKKSPLYNIVIAKARSGRDRQPLEVVGTYNPVPVPRTEKQIKEGILPIKDIKLDFDRCKYWIAVGAQPTDTVTRLLIKAGILNPADGWDKKGNFENREIVTPAREIN